MATVLNIEETAQINLKSARVRWSPAALELLEQDVAAGKTNQQIADQRGIDKARVAKAKSYHITCKEKQTQKRDRTTRELAEQLISRVNTVTVGDKLVWAFLTVVAVTILIAVFRILAQV
jgi:hypothetical protein